MVRRFGSTVREQPAVEVPVVITSTPARKVRLIAATDDGPRRLRQVPADTALRPDARLLAQAVRLLVPRASAQVWAELHERAFRRWSAAPASPSSTTSRRDRHRQRQRGQGPAHRPRRRRIRIRRRHRDARNRSSPRAPRRR